MITIDHQLLVQLGLGHLDDRQQRAILKRFTDILELRVGVALGESMTKAQLEIIDQLADVDAANDFLSGTIPEYPIVVRREFEALVRLLDERMRAKRVTSELRGESAR